MRPPASLRLARAERRVEILEAMVQERNRELAVTQEQAAAVHAYLLGLNNIIPGAMISASPEGLITRANHAAFELLGFADGELYGQPLSSIWNGADGFIRSCLKPAARVLRGEAEWLRKDAAVVPVLLSATVHRGDDGTPLSVVFVGQDLRERRRLELELRHAQKLESLGQLSAGVAHEINTPMQFIGDNLHFIEDAFGGLLPLLDLAVQLPAVLDGAGLAQWAQRLAAAGEGADLEFVRARLPRAIERALEGVGRVSQIVAAMKAFSHPHSEAAPVDLNKAIADTLMVAHNEYKYVAEVQTEFGELPQVICNGGDMNQVFLNLIVNAAHAIEAKVQRGGKGLIRIRTALEGDTALISVADDGVGIAPAIRHRIFDPFFTTKEVGKGTGQGLSIARSIVVEHHGGSLDFESAEGQGATFHVRIPVAGAARRDAA